ncbi:MAG: threonine--tRNA ligase [Vampirovibrionales bacterium]|nr:threonine--tRNA ligase [Vampirovibrionales bacterium]
MSVAATAFITVHLPDGSSRTLPTGSTGYDLAASIGAGLAKAAVAIVLEPHPLGGGNQHTCAGHSHGPTIKDFNYALQDGDTVKILTTKDELSLDVLRHSAAHILAQAVQNLYTDAKIAIGPCIEDGFYYDFDIASHTLTPEDFPAIEAEMKRIANQGQKLVQRVVNNPHEQVKTIRAAGEIYKADILEKYADSNPTYYVCVDGSTGKDVWFDVCEGPHVPDTSWLKAFKLLSVSGAYWRGDEKNAQLQRVYATAFWSQKDLDEFIQRREEADKRDHRKLARELDLFSIKDEVGPGLVLWHQNLAVVREQLETMLKRKLRKAGYHTVFTPHLAKRDLWDISGHTSHYLENMFTMDIEGQEYLLKPMNCPMHTMIFKSNLHSYRELPIRIAELGTVYRYEKSGVMHGLNRVRGFTQDDAHIFCRPDQVQSEIVSTIRLIDEIFKLFGMQFSQVELSTRPEKYVGELADWDLAESALKAALEEYGLPYEINEGDGAFYGPKIDFKIKDAIGRSWQCSTVQLDFNLPERFSLKYKDSDGSDKIPFMIHRAIFGSLERFAGILIEHYAGAFPAWLAPKQVAILTIADRHNDYAEQVAKVLSDADIRVTLDTTSEKINGKVRKAELAKIPYMLVLGDKEAETQTVSVRSKAEGKTIGSFPLSDWLGQLSSEVAASLGG